MRDVEATALAFDRALREAGVPYAFVGGIAVMAWGQPRATSDVDTLVALEPALVDRVVDALSRERLTVAADDFRDAFVDGSHVTVFDEDGPFHVDVKLAGSQAERRQVHEAVDVVLDGGQLRVARPEDTVAFKVLFGTPQDVQDARSIVDRQGEKLDLDRLRALARRLGVEAQVEELFQD